MLMWWWCELILLVLACTLAVIFPHSLKHKQGKQCSRMHVWACSFLLLKSWGEKPTYITSVSEVRAGLLGESQRSFCQCHLSSRLGTKEVEASVPLPPSCAPLQLQNKVPCWIRTEKRTPRTGESSISPEDNLEEFKSPMRKLKRAPRFSWRTATCSCICGCTKPSLCMFLHSPSQLFFPLPFLILLHLYIRSLTHSGMHSYSLKLRHPQTHKQHAVHINICK